MLTHLYTDISQSGKLGMRAGDTPSTASLGEKEEALSLVASWMLDGGDLLRAPEARRRARVAVAHKIDASVRLAMEHGNFHMAFLDWVFLRDEEVVVEVATEMGYVVRRANVVEVEDHYNAECQRRLRSDLGYRYQRMSKIKRNPPLIVKWSRGK